MNIRHLIFACLASSLFSCRSVPKDITYFQDFDTYHPAQAVLGELTLKNNDQLIISVASSSALEQMQVAQFNLPVNVYLTPGETTMGQAPAVQTYTIDKNGTIDFPVIGIVQLAGLTRSEAVELLKKKIADYLPDPMVNLQVLSFKVTVLGEVHRPGPVKVTDERITIFDAIGAANDLTIYGDRKNVVLIRDNNGTPELQRIDLTRSDIFSSPYYYLQQNDVLYVEPNNTKKKESHYGAAESYTISVLSISLTAVSVITTVLNILLKK